MIPKTRALGSRASPIELASFDRFGQLASEGPKPRFVRFALGPLAQDFLRRASRGFGLEQVKEDEPAVL